MAWTRGGFFRDPPDFRNVYLLNGERQILTSPIMRPCITSYALFGKPGSWGIVQIAPVVIAIAVSEVKLL